MPGFTKSSQAGYYKFLFGDGSDGDLTVASNTNLASTLNGDIVYKNYRNLTINPGAILSVSNRCKGLWIRVRDTLTLNGSISMNGLGGYIAGGAPNLYLYYSDIYIPASGGAGGNSYSNGAPGSNGGTGGGGGGGNAWSNNRVGGAGAAGYTHSGGGGGGGASVGDGNNSSTWYIGNAAGAYGAVGGSCAGSYNGTTGGKGGDGGGLLIIMANKFVGSGNLLAKGNNGDPGVGPIETNDGSGGGGGGGGGSITLYYGTISGTPVFNVTGGTGGAAQGSFTANGIGGSGGAGSARQYSLQQLLSHTRI